MIFTNLKDDLQNKILPENLPKCINYTKLMNVGVTILGVE